MAFQKEQLAEGVTLYCGDCREVVAELEGVATILTDPPYGLTFMGKDWDRGVPGEHFWRLFLDCCLPGAMCLAFGGTRTYHRLACAIEDAGWEIRDTILWLYGSGFPKSLDISKAIDKAAGAERKVVGSKLGRPGMAKDGSNQRSGFDDAFGGEKSGPLSTDVTAPATDAAREWNGWGTALKPACEPICLSMKPLDGTYAENAQKHGVAGLWIDGGRVPIEGDPYADGFRKGSYKHKNESRSSWDIRADGQAKQNDCHAQGRWPANVIHDGSEEVMAEFEKAGEKTSTRIGNPRNPIAGTQGQATSYDLADGRECLDYRDSGLAARFFYCAKASRSERGNGNTHPTVKPLKLMRYLARLTKTPTGGLVLDPFMGSGTTGIACIQEGRPFIGVELEQKSYDIARRRIADALKETPLLTGTDNG